MVGNLYVGCALTHASPEFVESVEETKDILRADWQIMDFVGTSAGSDKDVFEVDVVNNVRSCDAFLGICDEVSIGLGWELAEAANAGKPVLATAHLDSRVSRLVTGAAHFYPKMEFVRYQDMVIDVPKHAARFLLPKIID